MDYEIEMIVQKELGSNERLIWCGKPKQGFLLRSSDGFMIPFSILWGGFAFTWELGAIMSGAPFFFWIFGIPFVIMGLYLIFGRFIIDAKQRANTYYGVTNDRIIIISGLTNKKINSINIKTLTDVSMTEKKDQYGTIAFGQSHPMNLWFSGSWPGMSHNLFPTFEMIPDVKNVYEQIMRIQRGG